MPPATYLCLDKQLRDHDLFLVICRVNLLTGKNKEYGYIFDCKGLFRSLEGAVKDYTSGALDGYEREDVEGLLEDRLVKARERLEETREAVKAVCEPVEAPVRADESEKASSFDDMPLLQLIVECGLDLVKELSKDIQRDERVAAETIENNVRRPIIDDQPVNPKYYDRMPELLDLLIAERKRQALNF